jgi:hypothetical protein
MDDQYVSFSAAWFTLSLINAGLAQSKNRSGLNWWFLSLFIGPFATFLIVASPPPEARDAGTQRGLAVTRMQAIVLAGGLVLFVIGLIVLISFVARR